MNRATILRRTQGRLFAWLLILLGVAVSQPIIHLARLTALITQLGNC